METDKQENVRLYERFGYRVIAEEHVIGVPNWFMWRSTSEAQRALKTAKD